MNLRRHLSKGWLPHRRCSTIASLNWGLLDLSRAIGLLQHPKLGQQFSKPKRYVRWFLNPQGPGLLEWSFLVRAGYFYVLERYGKAILNCTEALRVQPRWAHAMLHRAFYKCHIDSADLAMSDLNEAIKTDPSCYVIFYNRACCQEMLHDSDAALQDYSTALLIAEAMGYSNILCQSKSLINRGLIYLVEHGDIEAAAIDFQSALSYTKPPMRAQKSTHHPLPSLHLANERSLLMHAIGLLNHVLLNYKDARVVFDKALADYPGNNELLFALANLLVDIGAKNTRMYGQRELKEAAELYLRVISSEPENIAAQVGLGKCQQISGCLMDAWHTLTKAISRAIPPNPSDTEFTSQMATAHEARAAVNFQMRRFSAAMCDINTALDLLPQWPEALTNRGILHHLQRNMNAARQDFLRALDLDPQNILSRLNYGILQLHTGRVQKALDCLSVNHIPRDLSYPELFLIRALCFALLGKCEEALLDLKAADEIIPTLQGAGELKAWTLVHNVKAVVFCAQKRWAEAEREYSTRGSSRGFSLKFNLNCIRSMAK